MRGACLVAGALIAVALILYFHRQRVDAAEIALGEDTVSVVNEYAGRVLNAHQLSEYAGAYPAAAESDAPILWLGNSQIHAINQFREGDKIAPFHSSVALGRPVRCLSIPNANLQEHLVVLRWALERNPPAGLVLPLVYDDLREDELRPEFTELTSEGLIAGLQGSPVGDRLADQLIALGTDVGEALDSADSLQQRVESVLEANLSATSGVWDERMHTLSAVNGLLYKTRNAALGISPTSKRKMIPVRYERNMAALASLLELARSRGVETLIYIAPLRWDVEPPYDLAAYRQWTELVRGVVEGQGARFVNLERLVPDDQWGSYGPGETIDFMHFQEPGHRLLGAEIARLWSEGY